MLSADTNTIEPVTSAKAKSLGYGAASEQSPALHAVINDPQDKQAIGDFLRLLGHLDPNDPRSGDLTKTLVTAISAPSGDAWAAESFAQRSLNSEFQKLLLSDDEELEFSPDTLSLIIALLYHRVLVSPLLEQVLIGLRTGLLDLFKTGVAPTADQINLAEAMARHSFTNEYLWDETDAEVTQIAELVKTVSQKIEGGDNISAFELYLIGAYQPLDAIPAVRNWVLELGRRDLSALDPSLRLLVLDRIIEDATTIDVLTPLTCEVSVKVQTQYEENPYPRWRHMPTPIQATGLRSYVTNGIGGYKTFSDLDPDRPKVLIAGAGTGMQPIDVALSLPNAAVLAIDLSRPSLAYASREANVRGVGNVAFAQADILKLSGIDLEFDLIESVGVIHHMKDPESGLRTLVNLLKPGGYLKLGLYSKAARYDVNAAREHLERAKFDTGLKGIRSFRRDLLNSDDPAIVQLFQHRDFYTASEFRDLVMHVQEHQFTLPQIAAMLKRHGLKFLGFTSPEAVDALGKMPVKKAQRQVRCLDTWHRYEQRNPNTFRCMYRFICMKR